MEKQGDNAFVNDGPASAATPKSAAGAFYILIADDNPLIQEGCWMRSRNGQTALDDRQATIQKCGEAALKSFGCRRAGGLVDLAELTAAPPPSQKAPVAMPAVCVTAGTCGHLDDRRIV